MSTIVLLISSGTMHWALTSVRRNRQAGAIEMLERLREMVDYKPGIGFVPETGLVAYRSGFRFHPAVDGHSGVILRE